MKVRLAARAARDLEHAVAQYEQELPGLGAALLQEVVGAIDFISAYPEASALGPSRSGPRVAVFCSGSPTA